jgi:protein-disulfide isomerase/uncharacterized membrane protein
MGLSIIGAVLSGILTHQHFFGQSAIANFFCGNEITNPCHELSLTRYSSLWGIPVSVYGLFFYILITGALLVADYAKGAYYNACAALLLPLSGLAVLADIILFIILIKINIFCPLCILTYITNILLFIAVFLWYKNIKKAEDAGLMQLYKKVFDYFKNTADSKAALSLFVLFAVFLAFSLLSAAHIMQLKTAEIRLSYDKIKIYFDEYNAKPVENIAFPESVMIAGNPGGKIKLIVFTDFLCSFCHKFSEVEEYLLSKYQDQLRIEYHGFPLDQACNNRIQRTVYNNSCVASAAMLASAQLGFFSRYVALHFNNYKNIKAAYNKEVAMMLFNSMGGGADTGKFSALMGSTEISDMIKNDIDFAAQNNINSTPTIFIGNKRITGARPKEVFDAIIAGMLK